MKNKKQNSNRFVQRIQEHYVSDDCIQIMIPQTTSGLTVFSNKGIIFHNCNEQPENYINSYLSDERKNKFPYCEIPMHMQEQDGVAYIMVNQLLEYNEPYIEITNGVVERYVVKDGNEALKVSEALEPSSIENKTLTNNEVRSLMQQENQIVLLANGMIVDGYFATEEKIVEMERKKLEEQLEYAIAHSNAFGERNIDAMLINSLKRNISGLSIKTIPPMDFMDVALVEYDKGAMTGIKVVSISFIESERYQVCIKTYPIKKYTLEEIKEIEQESSKIAKEPTFSRLLNFGIDRKEVKKGKSLIKKIKRK